MFKIFKPNKRRNDNIQVCNSMPHRTCFFDFTQLSKSKQKSSRLNLTRYTSLGQKTNRLVSSMTSRAGNKNQTLNSQNIYSVLKKNMQDKKRIYTSQKSLRRKQSINRLNYLQGYNSMSNFLKDSKEFRFTSNNNNQYSKIKLNLKQWAKQKQKDKNRKSVERIFSKNIDENASSFNFKQNEKSNLNKTSSSRKKLYKNQEFDQTSRNSQSQFCNIIISSQHLQQKQLSVRYKVKKIGAFVQFLKNYVKQYESETYDLETNQIKEIVCFQTLDCNLQLDYYLTLEKQDGSFLNGQTIALKPLYSIKQSMVTLNSFDIVQCIGSGGFSNVFLCRFKQNHKFYAMKVVSKPFIVKNDKKKIIMNERNIMVELRGKVNLAKLFFSFQSKQYLVFIMDYYEGGQLFNLVKRFRKMDQQIARFYITEILIGLEQVHDHNIVYRDFKPENIMIDIQGHCYIADFGLAKPNIATNCDRAYSFCGSPQYMPPQMIIKEGHSLPVDFYCIGALLYQLVTGLPPFYCTDPEKIYQSTLTEQITFPDHVQLSPELEDLLVGLLCKDETNRIGSILGVKQVLSHKWFKGVKKQDFILKKVKAPINFKNIEDLRFNIDQMHSQNENQMRQILKNQKIQQASRYLKIMNGFYYDYRVDQNLQNKQNQNESKIRIKNFKKQKNRISIQKSKNNSSSLALTNCTKKSQGSLNLDNHHKVDENCRILRRNESDRKQNLKSPFRKDISFKEHSSSKDLKSVEKRLLKNLNNFLI